MIKKKSEVDAPPDTEFLEKLPDAQPEVTAEPRKAAPPPDVKAAPPPEVKAAPPEAKAAPPTQKLVFGKAALVASDKYERDRDVLRAVLEDGKAYTHDDVRRIIEDFKNKRI